MSARKRMLPLLLLFAVATVGCDFQLGTPIVTDPGAPLGSLEDTTEFELQNPHLGLTASGIVFTPPAAPPPTPAPADSSSGLSDDDIQQLLDDLGNLAPADQDVINSILQGLTHPDSPDPGEDDRVLSWGQLKERYAPSM